MTIADLDGNGKPELIAAVMSFQKNKFSETVPVSTYIYVFEKKNNHYRYIWKSEPLFYLNQNKDVTGERIEKIISGAAIDDLSVTLVGDKENYKLEFIDGYYVMNSSLKQIEKNGFDKDLVEYLHDPVDAYFVFTGMRNDYFVTGKNNYFNYRITLYKISYLKSDPMIYYTRWNTVPLTAFKIIPGKKINMYIEATTVGTINIYSMKKI